jgi:glycosyltransferase involved in cell wall biosynthesis
VRIAFVMGGIPSLGRSGSTIAGWTILEQLLAAGHEVTAVLLPEASLVDETAPERFEAIERLGASVRLVETPQTAVPRPRWRRRLQLVRSLVWPRGDELFPALGASAAIRGELQRARAEAAIAFGFEAAAATSALPSPPVLALLSHPPGVSRRLRHHYRAGTGTLLSRVGERSFLAYADRRALALLRSFPSVGVFSRHHAEWASSHGVSAWYAHYPMPDLAGPGWRERRAAAYRPAKPRILMIGHLRGVGTIAGLHLFVPSILPCLTEALGPQGFEVHVVGGHDPPPELAEALRHPAVRLRGHIERSEDEFLEADVLLAPNPTTTGASARILSGLSFGNCVVAHSDSLIGIPELAHEENCLLAADGPGLAAETLRALADPVLRERLGEGARSLYEGAFRPEVAARRLVLEVERLASSASSSER